MSPSANHILVRAAQHLQSNQTQAARSLLEELLEKIPGTTQAWLLLGGIAWKEDRVREAVRCALGAQASNPAAPALVCDVLAALIQVGESAAAHSLMKGPLPRGECSRELLMRLSGQAQKLGDHPRALSFLQRAGHAGATGADFRCYLGVQLAFNGRLQEAVSALESSTSLNPSLGRAALMLARLGRQTPEHNHLARLNEGLRSARRGSEEHAALEFARYNEFEALGHYEDAWRSLAVGNGIMHALLKHDSVQEDERFKQLMKVTDASGWRADIEPKRVGPQPVFVIGMPRSGTTVLDRILGNHSQVRSAGELGDFAHQLRWAVDHRTSLPLDHAAIERLKTADYAELGQRYLERTQWRARGKPFYVDKLPANWTVAGLILRALPQARILHMVREPMDLCFSNYRALFGDSYAYSYDIPALARHYMNYREVMRHWHACFPGKILDVSYRKLVEDPETAARRVFAFCGLDYEPGCTDITGNNAAVATLSTAQVHDAIHTRAAGRWRFYAPQLRELQTALGAHSTAGAERIIPA